MKTKKIKSIIGQILIIVFINYLILFDEGFIYKDHWKGTFIFALAFFHAGTFSILYSTFKTIDLTKEKEQFLLDLYPLIYIGFLALLFYHNCQVSSKNLLLNYLLGLFTLMIGVILLCEDYQSFKNYLSNKINQKK